MRAILVTPFQVPFMARALVEMVVLGVLSGVVSVFVFLRSLVFVADTLTHTVFPGVVIGYLVAGPGGIFGGALVAGAVTAIALTLLTRSARLTEDSSLAVILTAMFAIGVILVSRRPSYTADLTAFLFGRLLTVTQAQIVQTAIVAALVLAGVAACAKELTFRAFDPAGARAAGYRLDWLDLLLNLAVALVVVAAAQAVGVMLVIALLVVPAAAARLITDRLFAMAAIGCLVAVTAGYLGLAASWAASVEYGFRLTSASAVVLTLVALYLLSLPVALVRRPRGRRRGSRGEGVEAA